MSRRHLALVGMMGAGKTSVGRICAQRLGRAFLDTDDLVESTAGMTVAEIFETQGEPAFRDLERVAVADACASPEPLVIACGGGAVLDAENRRALRDAGVVIWLKAAPRVLSSRCSSSGGVRPLLAGSGSAPAAATLERLAVLRADTYAAAAHAVVDTDDRALDEVAADVIAVFEGDLA